jgi:ubiquinone/menaquinone biosynthesis C-methylase UbiE
MAEQTTDQGQQAVEYQRFESKEARDHFARRQATVDAQFIRSYLQPGMRLLDCGCGPGSITLGLAGLVAPGKVVGVDISSAMIEQAKTAAATAGAANVRFEVADAYALPFAAGDFDVVFSHALLEHLPRPLDALAEMHRVLRPGGLVALRVPDWGGELVYPMVEEMQRLTQVFERVAAHDGSDIRRGRQLGTLLLQSGFSDVRLSASYTSYGTPEEVMGFAKIVFDHLLSAPKHSALILEQGWASPEELEQIKANLLTWAETPGAFHARAWVEAVARRP